MNLIDRQVAFVTALREAGMPVSLAEGIDATRALAQVDLGDREFLREAYAATLVKRHAHRSSFDTIFDLFYPAATGQRTGAGTELPTEPVEDGPRTDPAELIADPARAALRELLAELLVSGDLAALERLAVDAVGRFGAIPGRGDGQQAWSRIAVMNRMSPDTLMAGLLAAVLTGSERGGLAEQSARTMLGNRIGAFERFVAEEVQRRVAEELGPDRVARVSVRPAIADLDFLNATRADLVALRREVYPLARRLATRLAQSQRMGRRGQLDFRRTIRGSLSSGGVPLVTHHKPRRPHKTDLVVLCDVSESVTSFAHFTLLLVFALRSQFSRVRAFAFVDDVDEVTGYLSPGADVVDAMTALANEARVTFLFGRTDYGRALTKFAERYGDSVDSRTSLLILGDARSNYGDLALPVLGELVATARHAFWLNPEPTRSWDTGDSAASRYGELMPMVECRNLSQLSEFIRDLV